jgi:CYTH domain-containing protein
MSNPVSPLSGQEPLEIERKFLIEYPDPVWLERQPGSRRVEIIQTYLLSDGSSTRRVRSWTEAGRTVYIRTCKRRLSDRTRVEVEDELTQADYLALLSQADPARHPLEKTRWCIPFDSHVLEIDLYPFWNDQAVLEVELQSEGEEFLLPPEIRVIREITGDPRYLNSSLARELP